MSISWKIVAERNMKCWTFESKTLYMCIATHNTHTHTHAHTHTHTHMHMCAYTHTHSQLKPEMVDLVYACAKFKYECGHYSEASEYLYFYRVLVCDI